MKGRLILDTFEVDDVQFLAQDGLSLERVAARIGVPANTIGKTLRRHGRTDVLERLARNRAVSEMSR